MGQRQSSRVTHRFVYPFPPIFIWTAAVILALSVCWFHPSSAEATRLYLTSGGELSENPPGSNVIQVPVRRNSPREWRLILTGTMGGNGYGFNLYGQNYSGSGTYASVEIVLQKPEGEYLLASWPKGLGSARGPALFSGRQSGSEVPAEAGDALIVRIQAEETGKYHGYGNVFVGGQYPSSIDVPSLSALSASDMAEMDRQFSPVYTDLSDLKREQEAIRAQLGVITETLSHIEELLMMQLETPQEPRPEPPPPSPEEAEESVEILPLSFQPPILTLPPEPGLALVCSVNFRSAEETARVDQGTLRLGLLNGVLEPDPEYCLGEALISQGTSRLTACFPAATVAETLEGEGAETLVFTAWLKGSFKDGNSFLAKGILRVNRSE